MLLDKIERECITVPGEGNENLRLTILLDTVMGGEKSVMPFPVQRSDPISKGRKDYTTCCAEREREDSGE